MSIPFLTGDDLPPGEAREAVAPAPGQPAVRRILSRELDRSGATGAVVRAAE